MAPLHTDATVQFMAPMHEMPDTCNTVSRIKKEVASFGPAVDIQAHRHCSCTVSISRYQIV
jgi:hypothetical protein